MSRNILLVASMLVCVCVVISDPASFIKKCKEVDAVCAKESTKAAIPIFAAGLPEYGVHPLDPIFFKTIDATSNSLKLIMRNITIAGLSKCIPKKIEFTTKLKLTSRFLCNVVLDGQYEIGGRLLIIPIEGKGKIHVGLNKIAINVDLEAYEKEGKDGKSHLQIKTWSHSYELKDKSDLYFENLFNGNEVLARTADELIKTNSNDIVMEVGGPVIKTVVVKVIQNLNRFFQAVSIEDLLLDWKKNL